MTKTNIESQDCIIYLLWEHGNHPSVESEKINPLWMDTYHQTLYDQIVSWDKQRDLALFCLENKNNFSILWFKCKTAVVVPELEIMTNGVRAFHSASVGKIDEEQWYYLCSRGLSRAEAKKMIVKAFLA